MFSNNTEQGKKYRAILYIVILITIPFYLIGIGVASYKISENNQNQHIQTDSPQVIVTINGTLFVGSGTDLLTLVPFQPSETPTQTITSTFSNQPTKTLFVPPTYTPTTTLIPTWTFIPLPTLTNTATATFTLTPTLLPTSTSIPTKSATPIFTKTITPVPPTITATPVVTTTVISTNVSTDIPTSAPSETATSILVNTDTPVPESSIPVQSRNNDKFSVISLFSL